MDHLPPVQDAIYAYPQVQYYCDRPYDGQAFATYLQRYGYDPSNITTGLFSIYPLPQLISFLQNWLYFGVLHEIFGQSEPVQVKNFTRRNENGQVFVTTAHLDEYMNGYIAGVSAMEVNDATEELVRIQPCLDQLCMMIDVLCAANDAPLPFELVFSFSVLGATIDDALKQHLDYTSDRNWGIRDHAIVQMKEASWCIRDIHMVNTFCSETTMLFMSYLRRDLQGQDHSRCSSTICCANHIEEHSYVTRHVIEGCQCIHKGPPPEEIKRILRSGKIPIVSLTPTPAPGDPGNIELSVKAVEGFRHAVLQYRFRAISHVWSDGLGNTYANSLPHCQLKYLYASLKDYIHDEVFNGLANAAQGERPITPENGEALTVEQKIQNSANRLNARWEKKYISTLEKGSKLFRSPELNLWIDTLCVPLEDDYRKMAIKNMDKVYGSSPFSIVLDAELQRRTTLCRPEEVLARIVLSGWMRRAWTYQEGILAAVGPFFKFANTMVNLDELLSSVRANNATSVGSYAFMPKLYTYQKWANRIETSEGKRLKLAQQEERERLERQFSSPRLIMRDLASCFSSLRSLQLHPEEPVRFQRSQRIKSVWNGLRWRSTSKEDDKLVVFALACCVSVSEYEQRIPLFLDCRKEDRMMMWLSQQTELPAGLLFVKGPRMNNIGLFWAPSKLLPVAIEGEGVIDRIPGSNAAQISKSGFQLPSTVVHPNSPTFIHDHSSMRYYRLRVDWDFIQSQRRALSSSTIGLVMLGEVSRDRRKRAAIVEMETGRTVVLRGVFWTTADVEVVGLDEVQRFDAQVVSTEMLPNNQTWIIG